MQRERILTLLEASSIKTVTSLIDHFQNLRYQKDYFYKPIGIELEITNLCNLKCQGCPIINDELTKPQDILTDEEFIQVLKKCKQLGIFAYSITGGEPFLKFNLIKKILKANVGLDLYKLNTNGSFFRTINITKNYLNELQLSGFGESNRYIKSVLVISLGQQNLAGVPIRNAVHLISQVYNFFLPERVQCCLNITEKNQLLAKKIYQDFKKLYHQSTGKNFDEHLFKVRFFSLNSLPTLKRLGLLTQKKISIFQLIVSFKTRYLSCGCFNIQIKNTANPYQSETLIPRVTLRPNGDLYACFNFNYVHKIGNIKKNSLREVVKIANDNIILKTVFTQNLEGLYYLALKKKQDLVNVKLDSACGPCDLCQFLTNEIKLGL